MTERGKTKDSNYIFIPVWMLWFSLIVLTLSESLRLLGATSKYGVIIGGLTFLLLWTVPSTCIWNIIKRNPFWTWIPSWLLWIVLIGGTLFQLNFQLSLALAIFPTRVVLLSFYLIFFYLFGVLIPAYCMWHILKSRKKEDG